MIDAQDKAGQPGRDIYQVREKGPEHGVNNYLVPGFQISGLFSG
jgi:hypothetical protein